MNNTIKQVKRALDNSHGGMQTMNMTIKRQYVVELVHLAESLSVKVEQMEEEISGGD